MVWVITADSHEVVRKNTEKSHVTFTHFFPLVTSCRTIVKYHNKDINFDVVRIAPFPLPQGSLMLPFYSHGQFSPHPTPHLLLATTNLSSIAITLYIISRMFNKWDHTGCKLLGWDFFFSFNIILWRFTQVVYPFYVPFMAEQYSMVWMDHNLFNHLPAKGHLGNF